MLTLHIEAETITELRAKAMSALLHADAPPAITLPPLVPTPVDAVVDPGKPVQRTRKKAEPKVDGAVDADALKRKFEALVEKDYDSALSILDALGVATFKAAIDEGMGAQVSLALEAFV